MQDSPSNQGEKRKWPRQRQKAAEVVTETQAEQARATLNQMGYGVYATPSSNNNPTEAKSCPYC
jgi:hypothetical protein